ncbi:MAG: TonB-dependent receptor plug domain-containing protein, partial [Bacteroidota bacterium]
MKIASFLVLIALTQASAAGFSQQVTFKKKNVTFKQVFNVINKQTGYNVFWSSKGIASLPRLDADFENMPLQKVLEICLKNVDLTYSIEGKSIIIKPAIKAIAPPGIIVADTTITGSVEDAKGYPMPGVSLVVEGDSKRGTATDSTGRFVLRAKEGTTIKVSFVGYVSQTFKVTADRKKYTIILQEDVKVGEEIVITAYGKKERKEAIVGSVTTVKPDDLRIPASNLTNAMAGQIAGVIAFTPSGQPGVDNANFFIRGVTTFGYKQDPLILIDNVELTASDLARLNVDDIESFSILKDASATALYGARGGNGVILVKTKEGKTGKAQINLRIKNSISQSVKNLQLADPVTYMKDFNEAVQTRFPLDPLPYTPNKIANTQATLDHAPGSNPYVYPAVDWLAMLFKNRTSTQRGDLSLQGGGGIARYYVAGSFSNDNG